MDGGLGVGEALSHVGEVLLGEADDGLVNVAQNGLLNAVMLDDLAQDTAVTATDDEDALGVWVGVQGQVSDHLLVGELITLGALDDIVEDENDTVVGRLEDEDVLVLALLVVEDLLNLEGHGLAWGGTSVSREAGLERRTSGAILPGHMSEISRNHPSSSSGQRVIKNT